MVRRKNYRLELELEMENFKQKVYGHVDKCICKGPLLEALAGPILALGLDLQREQGAWLEAEFANHFHANEETLRPRDTGIEFKSINHRSFS